jgi:hypothetical protein
MEDEVNKDKLIAIEMGSSSANDNEISNPKPPKTTVEEGEGEEKSQITSTIDILESEIVSTDSKMFLMSVCLNGIETMTFFSILFNRSNESFSKASFCSILIVLVFSALSMTSTGYNDFRRLLTSVLALRNVENRAVDHDILLLLETCNFSLLFVTAIFIVPGQGEPLNIVLNCTALTAVSGLDEAFFKCFDFKKRKNPKIKKAKKEVSATISRTKNAEFAVFFGFIFFVILFVLLMVYSLYEFESTKTVQ